MLLVGSRTPNNVGLVMALPPDAPSGADPLSSGHSRSTRPRRRLGEWPPASPRLLSCAGGDLPLPRSGLGGPGGADLSLHAVIADTPSTLDLGPGHHLVDATPANLLHCVACGTPVAPSTPSTASPRALPLPATAALSPCRRSRSPLLVPAAATISSLPSLAGVCSSLPVASSQISMFGLALLL